MQMIYYIGGNVARRHFTERVSVIKRAESSTTGAVTEA
jgi:hypothetical protein